MNKDDNNTQKSLSMDQILEAIGGSGKYQYSITIIFFLAWFVSGVVLMSVTFMFNNPSFNCQAFGLLTDQCFDYVCSLPSSQWPSFVTDEDKMFKSLANQYGNFFCQDEAIINLYAGSPYLGSFIGFFTIGFFADNYGRKRTLIISWLICTCGCFLLIFSQSLLMAAFSLMMCGYGADAVTTITFTIVSESYSNVSRQKHTSLMQGSFALGSMFATLMFYLYENWQIATIFALSIPSFIILVLLIWRLIETPMFLIDKKNPKTLQYLNKIGFINKNQKQCLKIENIAFLLNNNRQKQMKSKANYSTPADLFNKQFRLRTISQCIIMLAMFCMYYSPLLIINQFGFDIYTSSTLLNIADALTYVPLAIMINKIKRKKASIILCSIANIICFILIFLRLPDDCSYCTEEYIQLALIFIFRFSISMALPLANIYQTQLYPIRLKNIALGIICGVGSISSVLSPLMMGQLSRAGINHFILFAIVGIVAICCYTLGPQTTGSLYDQQLNLCGQNSQSASLIELDYSNKQRIN